MVGFRISVAVCSATVAIALTSFRGAAADVDLSHATNDFVKFLAFVGAAPLAQADRDRVYKETEKELQSNSAVVHKADEQVRGLLVALPAAKEWTKADDRETLRLRFELLAADDPIRQIVDRTDPVVVFDRAHKHLVTEATLAVWQRACSWMADLLSVSGPSVGFLTNERAYLKANFASLSDSKAEQIAHIERNYPIMKFMLEHAGAAKRAEFVREARSLALDREQFGMRLAEAMSQSYDVAVHEQLVQQTISHTAVLNATAGYNYSEHVLWQRF